MTTTINDLNKIYDEAEQVDREIFAEMKTNVLLLAGDHYKKHGKESTFRDKTSQSADQVKLRLVKNHVHKIVRHYTTQILSSAPGTAITPQNDLDMQDQKDAELNQSVWNQAKADYRLKEKIRSWATDYVVTGEVAVKIFWDPNAGDLVGYNQLVDEKTGEPVFEDDPNGQTEEVQLPDGTVALQPLKVPKADKKSPVFAGKFVFERIFAPNLLREASKKEMRDDGCWIIRKMVPTAKLKKSYEHDKEKLEAIHAGSKDDFVVFDSAKAGFGRTKDETLVKEFYYPPCTEYPEGYFYITAGTTILEEGVLPQGIFPIAWAGFDEIPTSARAKSIISVAKPYIAEINRASSSMAMHQVTVGDDKILYQKGSKLEQGAMLPGVRGISYLGATPTILAGRDGGQYLSYLQSSIQEMYNVLMIDEMSAEKMNQMDPLSMMFRTASQQLKFSNYVEKFEQFLIDVTTIYLELAKYYLPDDALISAVGKREIVNISEFRKTDKLRYQIKVDAREDTLETQMGKQIWFQNLLQYAGGQLEREDIGKMMSHMPFGNWKGAFDDFTLDEENAKNDMLALERGQMPPIGKYDDPAKMARKLSARTRKADFQFLDPRIQQAYFDRITQYEELEADNQRQILAAQAQYIPTDGQLVKADMYVADPNNPQSSGKRAMFPISALEWLQKQMEAQGASLEKLELMQQGQMAEIAQMLMNGQQGGLPGQGVQAQGQGMPAVPMPMTA